MRRLGLCLALAAVGCISGKGEGDDDTGGGGASEIDGGSDGSSFDGDGPVVSEATITSTDACYVTARYDDPQGPADVRRGNVIAVDPATGTEVWVDELFVCIDYECVGSFREQPEYAPATCSRAADYEFYGQLEDRSGNLSERVLLVWE